MTDQLDNVAHLLKVLEIVKQQAPDEIVETWLQTGIENWMLGACRLDDCLGLKPSPGSRSLGVAYRYLHRDKYLRIAFEHCKNISELEKEISIFNTSLWEETCEYDFPPHGWSKLRANVWQVFRTGLPLPGTRRRLDKIVNPEPSSTAGSASARVLELMPNQKR